MEENMEISWYGHSCFKLKAKDVTLVMDPYGEIGLVLPKMSADIVTVSHEHGDHNAIEKIEGEPFVVRGPGEYEIKGVFIEGVESDHDKRGGAERGKNTIYVIHMDDLVVCHLGDLGSKLSVEQIDKIGNVDILLVPVGGQVTIEAEGAVDAINEIEPKVAIPMHYKIPGISIELDDVKKFCEAIGTECIEHEGTYKVQKKDLPEEGMLITLLKPAG